MQVNFTPHNLLPASGYVQSTIPDHMRKGIVEEIIRVEKAKEKSYQPQLVGALKHEYALSDLSSNEEFLTYIRTLSAAYDESFSDVGMRRASVGLTGDLKPDREFWVNYQQRGEYNPIHHHSGLYSFVLWIEIPYDLEEERELFKGNPEIENICSFSFVVSGDSIITVPISVDKSYEWEIILFPAFRSHTVSPFLTSDGTRISIAGNLTTDTARDIV